MNKNNIGQLISSRRKEKGLTQQELGDLLSVSSKTISKWETGNGMPDITILNKISQELEISIEELLNGKINNKEDIVNKIKINKNMIAIISIILIIIILLTIMIKLKKQNNHSELLDTCIITKTYDIKNIQPSNDGNYLYVTITEYQVEGAYTIKIPKSISKELEEGNAYIFTFETNKENDNLRTDILFANSKIINVKYTDKIGMDRESKSYCQKTQ